MVYRIKILLVRKKTTKTKQKATINPVNDDNQCFQYAATITLNHEKIGKHPDRISTIKPFIDKYNWEGINYTSEKDDWKMFEKNNLMIALKVLYAKKEKHPAYISKHNSKHERQVVLLMIPNREGWHYIALKKLSTLLRGTT